jgi:hypothetical protein
MSFLLGTWGDGGLRYAASFLITVVSVLLWTKVNMERKKGIWAFVQISTSISLACLSGAE